MVQNPIRAYAVIAVALVCLLIAFVVIQMRFPAYPRATSARALSQSYNHFNAGELDQAIATADALLVAEPNSVDALLAKAAALAQKGSLEFKESIYAPQAIELSARALLIDPSSAEAWRLIGYSYEIMQQYPDAHVAYENAIALDPNNAAAISQDAHAYDLQSNDVRAEAGYLRALALAPDLEQARMGLARIYYRQDKLTQALPLYLQIAESSRNVRLRAEAAYSAGIIQGALGQHAEALASMQTATTIDPTYALGWVGYGSEAFTAALDATSALTLEQRNDMITTSMSALDKAISINKNQSAAYFKFGVQLAALGQKDVGVQMLMGAKQVVPLDITLNAADKANMLAEISAALTIISEQ